MIVEFQRDIKRIIVKVGTSTLTYKTGEINIDRMEQLVRGIDDLSNRGYEVLLVSSGAVGAGVGRLHLKKRPDTLPKKQAVAAIGQVVLMHMYEKLFAEYGKTVAQILLTKEDFSIRKRNLNAKNTLSTLLQMGVIPIINENDTVAVDEMKVGDNDHIAALVSSLIDGDLLVLLSDIDGFYTENPTTSCNAKLYETIDKITPQIVEAAGAKGSLLGTGGMATKIQAAKIAMAAGVYMVIGNGEKKGLLSDIVNRRFEGTLFIPQNKKIHTKKKWLLLSSRPKGSLVVDNGAADALVNKGKSLLATGIAEVVGDFDDDMVVSILNTNGNEIGRGIVLYDSNAIRKVKGLRTKEMARLLGEEYIYETIIHRDNMSVRKG
ncbi:glutamate 5-kinase [endosymbiont 'TC1' of Trimyema compressum]|uniref:glutamate 5-kinase n=1 Tax=endosymbiont 'TC1' of Trimyema compressum TaxID=243899 RepID=UPI0007F15B93|nr:glutamate 5-kinase [endosymbiont 'TC1' of Trimyema compressum]AMP20747.1 glutamate 5-kinase [endosymbiont 'TC1' of Trimyema compressum]